MSNILYNIIVLMVCWVLVTGASIYVTYFQQPEEMERLEKAEKVARLREAEFTSLISEESSTTKQAEEIVRRWRARYKVIPQELSSPDVVAYLNSLSQSGFETFDITFRGARQLPDYNVFSFDINGEGYFSSLYSVVWSIENNRNFYRVENLQLDHIDLMTRAREEEETKLKVLVSFSMHIEAYFGGAEGLSATGDLAEGIYEDGVLSGSIPGALPPVPKDVLPSENPRINPFHPLIMETIPPNSDGLIDIEEAKLVSIVGDKAIFQEEGEFRSVSAGEAVYLGQVLMVDPQQGRVMIRMNYGGIIDEVELLLETGDLYRQALGPQNLSPVEQH